MTMPTASQIIAQSTIVSQHTLVRPNERLFGKVAKVVWPHKTAAHLAAATGASVRAAEYWIGGQREPSARAVQAILNEITKS